MNPSLATAIGGSGRRGLQSNQLARPHEVGEHKLRGRPADLLTGLLIEPVMNAAIDAGHGFFFRGLSETVEVPCDAW